VFYSILSLADLPLGQKAVLDHLDLPDDISTRLMQMGMIPGCEVEAAHAAPGGDPKVYRVDGMEIALRRETCRHIKLCSGSHGCIEDPVCTDDLVSIGTSPQQKYSPPQK